MQGTEKERKRILVVDDEPSIRDVLCELLSEQHECDCAGSAEEALALLRTQHFDLIISDITMSEMSGLELLAKVREISPDCAAIMISGAINIENPIEALRRGAFDYLTKPFNFAQVEAAVNGALERQARAIAERRHEIKLEELVRERTAERDHLVMYDAITSLPNRRAFVARLARALSSLNNSDTRIGVALLALDRFNKICDALGYAAGDELLRSVAARLQSLGYSETAHFGGGEFALLLDGVSETGAVEVGTAIQAALCDEPFGCDAHEIFLSISIGLAHFGEDEGDASTLVKNAGAALDFSRQMGGDAFHVYSPEMHETALKNLSLENRMRRAIEREEFVVYYQPQVCCVTGEVVGMEALVRWLSPEFGLIAPSEFIPLAEETGLIVPLGEQVLRAACMQTRAWLDAGLDAPVVSVNLSPRQFRQPDLCGIVRKALDDAHLDRRFLELELTESAVIQDVDHALEMLGTLKAEGIRFSIDDFGAGYSSLTRLKQFPLDALKIDRSFVSDSTTEAESEAIIVAVISLAHSLGLKVKAEGVETEEQLQLLRRLDCDEAQGYLFSRPLPAHEIAKLLKKQDKETGISTGSDRCDSEQSDSEQQRTRRLRSGDTSHAAPTL